MLRDMAARFRMQGLKARLAAAPTRGAARMLARFGPAGAACDADGLAAALAPLPVAALELGDDLHRLMQRLGLKTLGALMEVPRVALMRRWGRVPADANPLVLLDRALGRAGDPLDAPAEAARVLARIRLAEPVLDAAPCIAPLAADLCAQLAVAERGVRVLRLTIYRVDGEWRAREVTLAQASRDPAHLERLFADKLDGVDPGFGFDLVTLEAARTEPLALHQDPLEGAREAERDLAALLDRLSARLGAGRIVWSGWAESHLPERAERRVPAMAGMAEAPPDFARDRPLRLLSPPEEVAVLYAVPEGPPARFRWRRLTLLVVRFAGPERIAPEWWHDRAGTRLRDYYRVEVQDGRRFWLYREGVAGDRRGGDPQWFLHGVFG